MSAAAISLRSGDRYPYDDYGQPQDWAHRAARGVLDDLLDRRSIKNALDDDKINQDVRNEIVTSLAEIIRLAYAEKDA